MRFVLVCTILAAVAFGQGVPSVQAQDEGAAYPTASELFDQFMQQYSHGDYVAAKRSAERIDPVQLPSDQRVTLYESIKQIDSKLQEAADPATVLQRADKAYADGNLASAVTLYRLAVGQDEATDSQRAQATARLAEIERQRRHALSEIRKLIDEAVADNRRGDFEAAGQKLGQVNASDMTLSWFDRQRVKRQLVVVEEKRHEAAMIAEATRQAEAAPAETVAHEPEPVALVASPPASSTDSTSAEAPSTDETVGVEESPDANGSDDLEQQRSADAEGEQGSEPMTAAGVDAPESPQPVAGSDTGPSPYDLENDILAHAMRLRAAELIEKAKQAETNGQMLLARRHYEDAAVQDPGNEEAREGYERLSARYHEVLAPQGLLERDITDRAVRVEAVQAEFDQLIKRAEQHRTERKYAVALHAVEQAKIVLDRSAELLPTVTREKLRSEAVETWAAIRGEYDAELVKVKREEDNEQKMEAENRKLQAAMEIDGTVSDLLYRAVEFMREQRYHEALQLVDQARFLQPGNPAAELMQVAIEDSRRQMQMRDFHRRRNVDIADHLAENLEATIPQNELVQYPDDWPQLTTRRFAGLDVDGEESELNRRVRLKLQEHIDLPFENNELSTVIEYFRQTLDLNIVVNWASLEMAGIEQDTLVAVRLKNVPARQALKLLLAQASAQLIEDELDYALIEGIVNISTKSDLTRETVVQVYDIRDLLVHVPNFDDAPSFDLSVALDNQSGGSGGRGNSGGSSGGRGGGGSGGGGGSIFGDNSDRNQGDERDDEERRLEQIEQIGNLIRETVGNAEDWVELGGTVSSLRELNGNLIIKTTPDSHRDVLDLLGELRAQRSVQIHVESRFLLVDQNFLDEFLVDLDFKYAAAGNLSAIELAQDSISVAGRPSTGLPGGFLNSNSGLNVTEQPGGTIDSFGGFAPSGRSMDFSVSYMDDLEFNLFISATQASRRSIVLTAPRITFFNGQRAYLLVSRQLSFISDLDPVPDAAGFNPSLSVLNSGVVLIVEGTVSADRRYVTMTVEPSLANVITPIRKIGQTALVDVPQVGPGGNDDDDNTTQQLITGFVEAPELEITELRATVSVPDKGTIIMGGQRLVGEIEVEAGVPIISKIPILNRLTTNRRKTKDERTLLVLIKPTIIIPSEEEARLFPGLMTSQAR